MQSTLLTTIVNDLSQLRILSRDKTQREILRNKEEIWVKITTLLVESTINNTTTTTTTTEIESALGLMANLLIDDDSNIALDFIIKCKTITGIERLFTLPVPQKIICMALVVLSNGGKQSTKHQTVLGIQTIPTIVNLMKHQPQVRIFCCGTVLTLCDDHPENVRLFIECDGIKLICDWFEEQSSDRLLAISAKLCAVCLAQVSTSRNIITTTTNNNNNSSSNHYSDTNLMSTLLSILSRWIKLVGTSSQDTSHVFHVLSLCSKLSSVSTGCIDVGLIEVTVDFLQRIQQQQQLKQPDENIDLDDESQTFALALLVSLLMNDVTTSNTTTTTTTVTTQATTTTTTINNPLSRFLTCKGSLSLLTIIQFCNDKIGNGPRQGDDVLYYATRRLMALRCLSVVAANEDRALKLIEENNAHQFIFHIAQTMHDYDIEGTRESIQILRNFALAKPIALIFQLDPFIKILLDIAHTPDIDTAATAAAITRLVSRNITSQETWERLVDAEAISTFVDGINLDKLHPVTRVELCRFFSHIIAWSGNSSSNTTGGGGEQQQQQQSNNNNNNIDRLEALHNIVIVKHFVCFLLQSEIPELHCEAIKAIRALPQEMTPMLKSITLTPEGNVKLLNRLEQIRVSHSNRLSSTIMEDLEIILKRLR
jgi:hypothetical protein